MPVSRDNLSPIRETYSKQNQLLFEKAKAALSQLFPVETTRYRIAISNIRPGRDLNTNYHDLKEAILKRSSLTVPIHVDILLSTLDNKKLDSASGVRIMSMPLMTTLRTFVIDGIQYATTNQLRLRPGVYTKKTESGEAVSQFNLGKGANFKVRLEPETGVFFWQIGTAKKAIPLYPTLRAFGLTDQEISSVWGPQLLDVNRQETLGSQDTSIDALYERLMFMGEKKGVLTHEEKAKALLDMFDSRTELDPETTQTTLGRPYDRLTPRAILDATKKILGVFRGEEEEDERDSLEFKKLVTIDDFFFEALVKERGRNIVNRIKGRLNSTSGVPTLAKVMPAGSFTGPIKNFITTESITGNPDQINPVEIMDQTNKVTSLGSGGIGSINSIINAQRLVHPSHLGILDPIRTPENIKAGIDVRLVSTAARDDKGRLYAPFKNVKTGKIEFMHAGESKKFQIAFEDPRGKKDVEVLHNGAIERVSASKATHYVLAPELMYGDSTNLLPFLGNMQGNRAIMGSKQVAQALPLVHSEEPLIQVKSHLGNESFEKVIAKEISQKAPVSGVVTKVTSDEIVIKEKGTNKLVPISLRNMLPLNSKTYLHDTPNIKVGDKVERGQIVADQNFTRNGTLALGTNLNVAYMPFHGLVHEDSVIVSESAAIKLTSTHMYRKSLDITKEIILNKQKFKAFYPNMYSSEGVEKLDETGIIKPGSSVSYGEPLILALRKTHASPTDVMLGRVHKSFNNPYKDFSESWDKTSPGKVIDVRVTRSTVVITIQTEMAAQEGDKLGGRYGNKGIIARVLPDDQMPKTVGGDGVEVVMTPIGVISRVNPGQILETAVSKVAFKTGKPIVIDNFDGQDKVKWAKDLLKLHNIKDKEDVVDPKTGKVIKDVMVGKQNILKLHKTVDTNFSARATGNYDLNAQPTKGGIEGSKGLGMMEANVLLAHNARNILKEFATIKSQKNDQYWTAVKLGQPLPTPTDSFAFNKFMGMLQGMNVKVDRKGSYLSFAPMTDKDVLKVSNGEIKNPKQVKSKDLTPESGGLFDFGITGGPAGTKWSHIALNEPVINPMFEEPVKRLLGFKTDEEMQNAFIDKGGSWVKRELSKLDLPKMEKSLKAELPKLRYSSLDEAVKKLKYIEALKAAGVKPEDAYIISKIPVLPPTMRPIQVSQNSGSLMPASSNYLYRDMILLNDSLKSTKSSGLPDKEVKTARRSLYNSLSALQGLTAPNSPQLQSKGVQGFLGVISGAGKQPKEGYIQDVLLSRTADFTGRGTASPDPDLGIDQIGLPEDQAWTMYAPFVMRKLTQLGHSALVAEEEIKRRTPLAMKLLDDEMKGRPVLINRAPSLWRTNIMAAFPKRVTGKVLKIQPLIEEGMNLDYDGDALSLHVPVEAKAVEEAKKMTARTNFFSDKVKDDLLVAPRQEPVIGLWAATAKNTTQSKSAKRNRYASTDDAWKDYIAGKISLTDDIEVKNEKSKISSLF